MIEAAGSWLHAGTVGRPHGLDGSFHVRDPRPQLLGLGASVIVAGRPARIERRAGTDQRPIVRLEGITDRPAAAELLGQELVITREQAPALEPDEWWAEDLEGCAVHDGELEVGVVRRLLALPSCEVLEVARANGAGELLVPLIADAVRVVDIEKRVIDVDLQFLGEA